MQAVILAAGKGTRMGELVAHVPKPMLMVAGKTLLDYKFEVLPAEVIEVIVVVGYLGDRIRKHYGSEHGGRRIYYVEQEMIDGTAGALWRAKHILKDRFLVMMGDDIYSKRDVETCVAPIGDWTLVVQNTPDMHEGGNVEIENGRITSITEGAHSGPGHISTNLFCLDARIFSCPLVPRTTGSSEWGLPQTAVQGATQRGITFNAIPASFWIQISNPNDLQKAEVLLQKAGIPNGGL